MLGFKMTERISQEMTRRDSLKSIATITTTIAILSPNSVDVLAKAQFATEGAAKEPTASAPTDDQTFLLAF